MITASSVSGRVAVGAGLLAGAAAAATGVSEVRHRRALARDAMFAVLRTPLAGSRVDGVVSADGTPLHVMAFGEDGGSPLAVMAPGWTEELHYYDRLTRVLLGYGWRVVSFDLRGQGASGMPAGGDQALERYGEDVEAVVRAVADGRSDVLMAGHSLGAMAIAAWAASFDVAPRVGAVALMNTGFDGLVSASRVLPEVVPAWLLERLGADVLGAPVPQVPVSTLVGRAALRYIAFGPDAPEALVSFYEPMLWRCPARVRARAGRAMAAMNLLPAVARIDVPALVIAGACDRLTPVTHSRRIAQALPVPAGLAVLERVGHMSPLEAPERVGELLRELAAAAGLVAEVDAGPPAVAGPTASPAAEAVRPRTSSC